MRAATRTLLEDEGYSVIEARNGAVALEWLRRGARPAILLVDLMMPIVDGRTLLEEIESSTELASLPVVVMTAADCDALTSALRYPLLRKPFDIDALLQAISAYVPRIWDDDELPTEEHPVLPPPSSDA